MCTKQHLRAFGVRCITLLVTILLFTIAEARPTPGNTTDEIYITINAPSLTIKQVFDLIQRQSRLAFTYDETEIDLSKEVKLEIGSQSLTILLKSLSVQTSLSFTQKQNTILVKKETSALQKRLIVFPVSGIVKDTAGIPVSGATISVKGSNLSTTTDINGKFSINVPENAVLVVSHVGYQTQEISVSGRASLEIILLDSPKKLEDVVVVVGYQVQRRSDLTGAVSVINVGGISKLPVATVDQALQGKASGVRVTQSTGQPGEGVAVRIRGVGTVNDNNPLYIVDGIPTKDGINFLSPGDIESISILKDAASASIYGARSSNGVVVITTKAGKRGKAQINYSGYGGVQTHGDLPKMANTQQYTELYNEAAANDNVGVPPAQIRPKIPDGLNLPNTDWLNEIFQDGQIQSHQISVRGGGDKTLYYLSGNYFKQDGIIINSSYERYSLLSKLNIELSDKFSIAHNINVSYSQKNIIGSSGDGYAGNGGSVIRYALFRTPAIPVFDSAGIYSDLPAHPEFFGDGYNPVALAEKTDDREQQYRVFSNLNITYKIFKPLKFKTDFGVDAIITDARRFDENYGTNKRINNPSRLTINKAITTNFVWNNVFTYNKIFNSVHNVNALAGTEAVGNNYTVQTGTDKGFANQDPSFRYIGNGDGQPGSTTASESQSEWALFSLFANVNYAYQNLYLASFSVRRDGSSRFGPENKYGTFYSGSAGWNLHNQEWVAKNLPSVSKLKIRASYGQLGNQEILNYGYVSIINNLYNYPFGQIPVSNPGSTVGARGNPKIKWESSTQADAGIDVGLWKDKLSFTVDYFVKTTSDMLIQVPVPLIGGSAAPPYLNAGEVQNKGLEVEINYKKTEGNFKYDIAANFSTISNKVISLSSNGQPIASGRIDNDFNATLTTVGRPIGSFYLYEMDGIFQTDAEIFASAYQGKGLKPGDVRFKDQNGDGIIDDKDRTFLGSAIPTYSFGLTTNMSYKNFDVSIFFQGQQGNKIYSQVNMDIEGFYRPFNVTQRVYDQRWHGEGTSNSMPRVSFRGASNNKYPSSRFLEDGSYVRLKNLQIGYSIPEPTLKRWGIKSLRFYVTGQNLWTWTNYTGLDPEMHISDNVKRDQYAGDVAAGIDWGTYPSARSYVLGVNLNF